MVQDFSNGWQVVGSHGEAKRSSRNSNSSAKQTITNKENTIVNVASTTHRDQNGHHMPSPHFVVDNGAGIGDGVGDGVGTVSAILKRRDDPKTDGDGDGDGDGVSLSDDGHHHNMTEKTSETEENLNAGQQSLLRELNSSSDNWNIETPEAQQQLFVWAQMLNSTQNDDVS